MTQAIMTPMQVFRDLCINIMTGRNTIIVGEVGIAKTSVSHQAIAACNYDRTIDRRLSQMAPTDLMLPFPNASTGKVDTYIPSWLPTDPNERVAILFDEYTNAPVPMQAAVDELILEGTLGGGAYRLPPHAVIIGTGNRMGDRAAAQRFSLATSNRLSVMLMGVHVPSWLQWAEANGIAPEFIAFIRWCDREGRGADFLHKLPPAGHDPVAFPTPRSITAASRLMNPALKLTDSELQRNIAHDVGDDWSAAFMAFLKTYRLAPDRQLVINDPDNAPVPREPAVIYALTVGLSAIADTGNLAAIARYANRLDPAYAASLWASIKARKPELASTPEYVAHKLSQE